MGYLLASVKEHPNIFQPDCQEIMETMVKMSLSMHADDPLHKAIFVVYENVVTSLKGNFLQNLEYMLTMNIDDLILVEILKTLCYLYQAIKYDSIHRLLKQTFLLSA